MHMQFTQTLGIFTKTKSSSYSNKMHPKWLFILSNCKEMLQLLYEQVGKLSNIE